MEAVGLGVGLLTLFSTCVECWAYIDSVRAHGIEYILLTTKLEIEKVRFLRWGESMGLYDLPEDGSLLQGDLASPRNQRPVEDVLSCIQNIFTDSQKLVDRYGIIQTAEVSNLEASKDSLDLHGMTEKQMTKFKSSYQKFSSRINAVRQNTPLMQKTRWAIRDRTKFSRLADDLKYFIDALYEICPTSASQQASMIAEAIRSLQGPKAIKIVQEASADFHQDWSDAATEFLGDGSGDVQQWLESLEVTQTDVQFTNDAAVQILKNHGRDTNATSPKNLCWAAENGQEGVIEYLLRTIIDVNTTVDDGQTPLHLAATNGHLSSVKLLVERGAIIEKKNQRGATALLEAANHGFKEVAEALITAGANVHARDTERYTSLIRASQGNHIAVMQVILVAGADVEACLPNGETALLQAAGHGATRTVQFLLGNGADIEARDSAGRNPLNLAATSGHVGVVVLLIDRGANIHAKDNEGGTALHRASDWGHIAVIQLLIEFGADIKAVENHGRTVLHGAAQDGRPHVIELLVKSGVDINARGHDGETALIDGVNWNRLEVVKVLLELGADKSIPNHAGQDPLYLAKRRGYKHIERLLE